MGLLRQLTKIKIVCTVSAYSHPRCPCIAFENTLDLPCGAAGRCFSSTRRPQKNPFTLLKCHQSYFGVCGLCFNPQGIPRSWSGNGVKKSSRSHPTRRHRFISQCSAFLVYLIFFSYVALFLQVSNQMISHVLWQMDCTLLTKYGRISGGGFFLCLCISLFISVICF